MAKSHVVVGLGAWLVAAPMLHFRPLDPLCIGAALFGALLPDIDHPASWVGKRCWPVSAAVAGVFGHRGVTHSAVAVAGLVALLLHGGSPTAATAAFAVGYLSHLAADMLSPRGLRLAWPLRGTWSLPVYQTGKASEAVLVAGLCFLAGWAALQGADVHGTVYGAVHGAAHSAAQEARTWLDRVAPPVARDTRGRCSR